MSVLMWFHAALAVLALALGPVLLFRFKGTRAHRWLGFAYVAAMLMVAVSGILIAVERGRPSIFLLFSVIVLVSIPVGMWGIWRAGASQPPGRLEAHFYAMSWSYAGLLLALCSQALLQAARWDVLPGGTAGWLIFGALMIVGNLVAWVVIERLRGPVLRRYAAT